jgi:hypothetical protein
MTGKKGQLIPADTYPQMANKVQAAAMSRTLRSAVTIEKAARVIEDAGESLRAAILGYVVELENAGRNNSLLSEKAHEIKGFAETAGLLSTGRIAEGLCRYFEDSEKLGLAPEPAVVSLHVSAIGRAARDQNVASQMSDAVARELAGLVAHKLAEASFRKSG